MENTNFSPSLTDYVKKLLQERGFEAVDPQVLDEMRLDLMERVQKAVNLGLVKNLPMEKLEEANTVMDSDDDAKIQAFFAQHIPNIEEVVAAELIAFRERYLGAEAQ